MWVWIGPDLAKLIKAWLNPAQTRAWAELGQNIGSGPFWAGPAHLTNLDVTHMSIIQYVHFACFLMDMSCDDVILQEY